MNEARNEKLKRLIKINDGISSIQSNRMQRFLGTKEAEQLKGLQVEFSSLMKELKELPYELETIQMKAMICYRTLDNRSTIIGTKFTSDGSQSDYKIEYDKDGVPICLFKYGEDPDIRNHGVKYVKPIEILNEEEIKAKLAAEKLARANRPKKEGLKPVPTWKCENPNCGLENYYEAMRCVRCGQIHETLTDRLKKDDQEKVKTNGFLDRIRGKSQ